MSEIAEITELRHRRAGLIDQMRGIMAKADGDKRSMTAEEAQEFDRIEADITGLDGEVGRRERMAGLVAQPDKLRSTLTGEPEPQTAEERAAAEARKATDPVSTAAYRQAFHSWVRSAAEGREMTADERRDLSVGTNSAGGYTVPTELSNRIVEYARQFGVMRDISTVIVTSGGYTLQVPKLTGYGASAWETEASAFAGTDPTFAQASLGAYKATHIAKVSEELLADSLFDIEGLLSRVIGQNLGVIENTAFVVGTGSGQPTGITTQTTAGKTGTTGQTLSVIAADLFDLFHSVIPPYRRNATWVANDASIKVIRKITDSYGQYLWQPGLQAGQPDVLLGRPILPDPDVAVMAANAKSILFGDFSAYYIRVAGGIAVQRLNELYAANGQVGFRAYERVDGFLMDTNAVKHYANSAT